MELQGLPLYTLVELFFNIEVFQLLVYTQLLWICIDLHTFLPILNSQIYLVFDRLYLTTYIWRLWEIACWSLDGCPNQTFNPNFFWIFFNWYLHVIGMYQHTKEGCDHKYWYWYKSWKCKSWNLENVSLEYSTCNYHLVYIFHSSLCISNIAYTVCSIFCTHCHMCAQQTTLPVLTIMLCSPSLYNHVVAVICHTSVQHLLSAIGLIVRLTTQCGIAHPISKQKPCRVGSLMECIG